jgi:BirA family biotin operon repressor/biotin-[acetyl-CoA-carboxylase] ligase
MSRSFFSPDGTGIYMSVIVRRPVRAQDATRLTTLAAVATAQAIESMIHGPVDIKWVNDIYLKGRKVCGILCEGAVEPGTQNLQYAVIGIGVNVISPKNGFPEEIREIAGAVFDAVEDTNSLRDRLIGEILDRLAFLLDQKDRALCLAEYRRRSMVVGREVTVHSVDGTSRAARALQIDDEYRLIVQYESGETSALDSGEVSIRL